MKIFSVVTVTAALLLTAAGCRTAGEPAAKPELRAFSADDTRAAKETAAKFAEGFAASLKDGDFAHWRANMPEESAAKVGDSRFRDMRAELTAFFGEFTGAEFLGEIITGDLRNYLWKLSFVRKEKEKRQISEIVYFVRVFCEEGKPPAISGFGVKRF